jgi:hypothetical protein
MPMEGAINVAKVVMSHEKFRCRDGTLHLMIADSAKGIYKITEREQVK